MPLLVHAATTNCSAYGRARDTYLDYCLLFFATLFFCCFRRVVT
jgi:hypothetical protein